MEKGNQILHHAIYGQTDKPKRTETGGIELGDYLRLKNFQLGIRFLQRCKSNKIS
jgi:hypothetical protein